MKPTCLSVTGREFLEELEDVAQCYGTFPNVLRCDNGPPFNGKEVDDFCRKQGILLVRGVPHHAQGQGLVERRNANVAFAFVATLCAKATDEWQVKPHLGNIEFILNTLYSEPFGGSPFFVMNGYEPRTALCRVDWSSAAAVSETLGVPKGFTLDDMMDIVAARHARPRIPLFRV